MQAYCFKCKDRREIQGLQEVVLKNGRDAVHGTCPECGGKLFRIGKVEAS